MRSEFHVWPTKKSPQRPNIKASWLVAIIELGMLSYITFLDLKIIKKYTGQVISVMKNKYEGWILRQILDAFELN